VLQFDITPLLSSSVMLSSLLLEYLRDENFKFHKLVFIWVRGKHLHDFMADLFRKPRARFHHARVWCYAVSKGTEISVLSWLLVAV